MDQCTKGQLLKVAEHYDIEIADTRSKKSVKACLKGGLVKAGVLCQQEVNSPVTGVVPNPGNLTFEQQKELLQLQLEVERLRGEKELQLESLKHKTECVRLEVQQYQLQLVNEGKLADVGQAGHTDASEVSLRSVTR